MESNWYVSALPVLIIVATVGLAVLIPYLLRQAQNHAWGDLASQLGLTLETGGSFLAFPKVTGNYRGHDLVLDTFTRGYGKQRRTYTRIVMTINNPANVQLSLYDENVFSRVAQALGSKDIQVDDPEIDRRFRIQGQPEEAVKLLFESGMLREQLLDLKALDLGLDGTSLRYSRQGIEKGIERLQNVLNLMGELATQVEQNRI